jgi:hypothetical protein
MSQLNVSQLVKYNNAAAQFDAQFVSGDGNLDNIGVFALIRDCSTCRSRQPPIGGVIVRVNANSRLIGRDIQLFESRDQSGRQFFCHTTLIKLSQLLTDSFVNLSPVMQLVGCTWHKAVILGRHTSD